MNIVKVLFNLNINKYYTGRFWRDNEAWSYDSEDAKTFQNEEEIEKFFKELESDEDMHSNKEIELFEDASIEIKTLLIK